MKKFNLERALAGDPIVTRAGKEVTQIKSFEVEKGYNVVGIVDGEITTFTDKGQFDFDNNDSDYDLFMATVKKTYWTNFYQTKDGDPYSLSRPYYSKEEAERNKNTDTMLYHSTIEITVEI